MINKAKEKLNSEISKSKNPYVQLVGQFLLQHLEADPGAAEKILQEDNTISKSLDAMKEAARKKAVGGCLMLTDQEGFAIVLKYLGISGQVKAEDAVIAPVEVQKAPEVKTSSKGIDFDVKLEDFV